jgi:hypothetical protein
MFRSEESRQGTRKSLIYMAPHVRILSPMSLIYKGSSGLAKVGVASSSLVSRSKFNKLHKCVSEVGTHLARSSPENGSSGAGWSTRSSPSKGCATNLLRARKRASTPSTTLRRYSAADACSRDLPGFRSNQRLRVYFAVAANGTVTSFRVWTVDGKLPAACL